MEKGFFGPQSVKAGADVHVLFYQDSQPYVLAAKVGALAPMALTTSDPKVHLLKPSMRSILVTEENGAVAKAECRVTECEAIGDEWSVQVDVSAWEELDRRRYPRHPVNLPVKLRLVTENPGGAAISELLAVIKDLSLGGALIEANDEIKTGSLVELQVALRPKEHARVLAVVVREMDEEKQYGLEFLDFIGGSRYSVHGFLADAA